MAGNGNPVLSSDVAIELFREGRLRAAMDVTDFRETQDSDIRRRKLLGARENDVRVVRNGWSGSLSIERTDVGGPDLDDLIDYLDGQFFRGEPVDEIQITKRTEYEDGTSRTYVYPGIRLTYDESGSGDAFVGVSLNWTSGRERVKP